MKKMIFALKRLILLTVSLGVVLLGAPAFSCRVRLGGYEGDPGVAVRRRRVDARDR